MCNAVLGSSLQIPVHGIVDLKRGVDNRINRTGK